MAHSPARLARLLALHESALRVLPDLAAEVDGEARERVLLAAQVVAWEGQRAIEEEQVEARRRGN